MTFDINTKGKLDIQQLFKMVSVPIFTVIFFIGFAKVSFSKEGCLICHNKEEKSVSISIHSKKSGISCVSCHGGDINATDGMAHATDDFNGKVEKTEVPKFCATCHSDSKKMRAYGLPSDQYDQYKISQHGIALAKGIKEVAVCTDCHGAGHKIVSRKDANSPVYVKNIAKTCGECHSNKELMQKFNISSTTVDDYMGSVHADALYKKGLISSPTCTTCHSSHGASPPGIKEVSYVCGKCHINEKNYFSESPHAKFSKKIKFSECISCHTNHKIIKTSPELYDSVCVTCHNKESKEFKHGQDIKLVLISTNDSFLKAKDSINVAKKKGLDVEGELNEKISSIQTSLLQSQPITHSMSLDKINEVLNKAKEVSREISNSVQNKLKSITMRKIGLLIFWIFILIVVSSIFLLLKILNKNP